MKPDLTWPHPPHLSPNPTQENLKILLPNPRSNPYAQPQLQPTQPNPTQPMSGISDMPFNKFPSFTQLPRAQRKSYRKYAQVEKFPEY